MGLFVAYSLFHNVSLRQVFEALETFYALKSSRLERAGCDDNNSLTLYEPDGAWTVLELGRGWAWQGDTRLEAQRFVSEILSCSVMLVSVCDGDYWQYELFEDGVRLDHFIQETGPEWGPPGKDADASTVISKFPFLKISDVAPYLIQADRDDPKSQWPLADTVRPGDEFGRYDQCAVLDFLRMLGLHISLIDRRVTLASPIAEQFWIKPYDNRH